MGCWIEITWYDQKTINKSKKHRTKGFIDLDSGEFYHGIKKDFKNNKWICDKNIDEDTKQVIKRVADHMLEKWQRKFEKEQRT